MKKSIIVAMLLCVLMTSFSYGYEVGDYDWYTNPDNGHQYSLTINHSNWLDAEAEAVGVGGHLVTVNDAAEQQWLLGLSNPLLSSYARDYQGNSGQNGSWIGMFYDGTGDINQLDSWLWLTGEVGSEFLVPAGSFYNYNGLHMVLIGSFHSEIGMISNGPHHDDNPSFYLQGIIEVVPEPTTLSLLALGSLCTFYRRKRK
jgi:hypothetical protein